MKKEDIEKVLSDQSCLIGPDFAAEYDAVNEVVGGKNALSIFLQAIPVVREKECSAIDALREAAQLPEVEVDDALKMALPEDHPLRDEVIIDALYVCAEFSDVTPLRAIEDALEAWDDDYFEEE